MTSLLHLPANNQEAFNNESDSNNETSTIQSKQHSSHLLWYVCVVISGLCTFITLYLIICVIAFIRRTSSKNCETIHHKVTTRRSNTTNTVGSENDQSQFTTTTGTIRRRHEKSKAAKWMHCVLLATLVNSLVRVIVEQLILFYGNSSTDVCNVLTKVMISLTAFSIHGCLVFLWLRQYVFYLNPLLRKIRPKCLMVISYTTYIEMVITVLSCLVLHLWWRNYDIKDGLCQPEVGKVKVFVPFGILVASTVTIQMSLTFLFVYPIVCHNAQMKKNAKQCAAEQGTDTKARSQSTSRLIKCVKRALLGCTISITTDVIGGFVYMFLPEPLPVFFLSVLYELDIMLNIFCLFYTYVKWRKIIFPWRNK